MMEQFEIQLVHANCWCCKSLVLLLLLTGQGIKSDECNQRKSYSGDGMSYNETDKAPFNEKFSKHKLPNVTIDCGDPDELYSTVNQCQNQLLDLASSGYPWLAVPSNSSFVGNKKKQNMADINIRFGDSLDSLNPVCYEQERSQRCLLESDVSDTCLLVADLGRLGLQVTFDFICNQQQRDENLIHSLECIHDKRTLSMLSFQIMQRCGFGILDMISDFQSRILYYILEKMNVSYTQMVMHSMLHLYCVPWRVAHGCVYTIVQDRCGTNAADFVWDFILHFRDSTRKFWNSVGVHEDICDFGILHKNHKITTSLSVQGISPVRESYNFFQLLQHPGAAGTAMDTTYGRYLVNVIRTITAEKDICHNILTRFLAYSACVMSSEDLSQRPEFNILQFAHQLSTFPYHGSYCNNLDLFKACWSKLQEICGGKVKGFALQSLLMVKGCNIQESMYKIGCEWQDMLLPHYLLAGQATLWPLVVQAWDNPMFLDSGVYSFTRVINELDKAISLLQPGVQEISRKCGSEVGKRLSVFFKNVQRTQRDALSFHYIWESLLHELNGRYRV